MWLKRCKVVAFLLFAEEGWYAIAQSDKLLKQLKWGRALDWI